MKQYKALFIFALGLILIVCGFTLNGQSQIQSMLPIKEIEKIKIQDINILSSNKDLVYSIDDIKSMSLEIASGELSIKETDRDDIEIKLLNSNKNLIIENEAHCLKIEQDDSWININNNLKIVIEVPKYYRFKNTELKIGAGKVNVDCLNTGKLEAEVGAGELIASKVIVDESIDIECGMGNVEVELDMPLDEFAYDIECGMGNVVVGDERYSGTVETKSEYHHKSEHHHNEKYTIHIECGLGNVEIKED